ncbi:MAG: CapA family protein [Bacillota bacterium]
MGRIIFIFVVFVLVLSFTTGYMFDNWGLDPIDLLDSHINKTHKDNSNGNIPSNNENMEKEGPNQFRQEDNEETVILSFAGDVLLVRGVAALIEQKGADFILSGVKPVFDRSDISMVNLECPVSEKGTKAKDKQYTFRAKPKSLEVLTSCGIDMVTLANNHILDFGREALLDTLQNLKERNIKYVGAGVNMDEASKPVFIDKKGLKIAFIASSRIIPDASWTAGKNSPGVATTYNPERILAEIKSAKEQADIVAVYVHWGEELKEQPLNYQKSLARAYVDKGADIVIGSHPHVLQGLEFYKGKIIAYSLGNFVFTNIKRDTMILSIGVNKKGIKDIQVLPCRIENLRPVVLNDKSQSYKLLQKIESLSFNIEIDKKGNVKPG